MVATMALRSLCLVGTMAVSACAAVGPNFVRPLPPVTTGYAQVTDKPSTLAKLTSDNRVAGRWWSAFGSRSLDEVMTRALANNQTLATARATLEKSRDQADVERARLGPSVSGSADFQRERINTAAFGFAGFPSPTLSFFNIGPSVTYDLDVAGGGRRRVESLTARAEAETFRADAAYLALTGNVALEATRIAALRAQIQGINSVAEDDRKSIEILGKAEAAGGESPAEGLGGRLQLEQDLALLPPLEQKLAEARHTLTLLAGEAPDQWTPPDFSVADFQSLVEIPVALPSTLVRVRPDIRAAEADLHAETAAIGVESAKLYPDVRLVGSVSQQGVTPGSLFGLAASAYSFGPIISAPLFDGGAIRASRRAAQAQARASLARYRQTVLSAFIQVSNVLSALARDEERISALENAETTARRSLDSARSAYELGGAPLVTVVKADRIWRRASLAKVEAIGQRLQDVVALFAATAADWKGAETSPKSSVGRPG